MGWSLADEADLTLFVFTLELIIQGCGSPADVADHGTDVSALLPK